MIRSVMDRGLVPAALHEAETHPTALDSGDRAPSSTVSALRILPWLAIFVGFLGANAWIRREWMWIVGDDQNLMMPAINIGRGLVPNIDFMNGYPGLTFYVQRVIMLVVGELPISQHVYTAIQASLFALVAAWVLRRQFPPALTWLLILFLWTLSHRINPTPNPGYVLQSLAILSLYWMDRFGSRLALRDAMVAGSLGGLAFLFKQPGIFLPVVFLLYSSYALLAWANPRPPRRVNAVVVGANLAILMAFSTLYLGASVFGVVGDPSIRQGLILGTLMFVGPWAAAVAGLMVVPGRVPPRLERPWSLGLVVRANASFLAGFVVVNALAFLAIYGSSDHVLTALRSVLFDSPQLISGGQAKLMQPLLLLPVVAIAVLVILSPFAIAAARSSPQRLAIFAAASIGCAYTALTYSDLQFTIAPTLLCILMVALFWWRRPSDPESWNRFFIFLGATSLLAYLAPHPKYWYSLGILAVSGWYMLGFAAPRLWPRAMNVIGSAVVVGISIMTLRWASAETIYMAEYQVGVHTVRSYDGVFADAVAIANASSIEDWLSNRYDYLVYLAHKP